MIRTDIGHVGVTVGDHSYTIIPSFINISMVGTPREIVKCFELIDYPAKIRYRLVEGKLIPVSFSVSDSFAWASRILNCCGLPESVTGWTVCRDNADNFPTMYIVVGKIPVHDVFVLAAHCLKHAVIGPESDDKGEPMTEFDAKYFIMLAQKVLEIPLDRAESMTMTELAQYMDARKDLEDGKHVKRAELHQQKNAFAWYKNRGKK